MWKSQQAVRSVGGRNNAIMIIWTELPNIIYHCLDSQHSRTTTPPANYTQITTLKLTNTIHYHSGELSLRTNILFVREEA